ncbi:CapA family protein [Plantactinospora sp. GCM10030261]|uniref:CapA family protein n=1 Tax=Plantactinospora sp. GCM10030261 TaxID=3273420 RepID=UPI00361EA696
MDAYLRPRARGWAGRRLPAVVAAVLITVLAAGCGTDQAQDARWQPGPGSPSAGSSGSPAPSGSSAGTAISLSATGDIIMGNAPNRLPANGGKGFFSEVREALAADLVMGNLEEPLTDDTGSGKCGAGSTNCHQFRAPPSYAKHLVDAGFHLLNQANNHGNDFGAAGYRNTQRALEQAGLKHTGAPDQVTVVDVQGVSVAVVGFSSYPWSNSLTDLDAAAEVIKKADQQADLVVVQVHMGAEGSDKIHVKQGTEIYLGENRGNPKAFSRTVIDAGADLVIGHGPHVLRGLEFYQGRLIAYSLGNFAGGGGILRKEGRLGLSGIVKVSLRPDGTFEGGQFISTYLNAAGRPVPDSRARGLALVKEVTSEDFGNTGANLDGSGRITPPAAG